MWVCKSLVTIIFLSEGWTTIRAQPSNHMSEISEELTVSKKSTDALVDVVERQTKTSSLIAALFTEPQNNYRITRVSKRDMGDHYQVTFDYVPSDIRPKVEVGYPPRFDAVFGGDGATGIQGQVLIALSKSYMLSYNMHVYFTFPHGVKFSVSVLMDNDTLEEMVVPLFLTTVVPHHGDLVFEADTQPQLELMTWAEELAGVTMAEYRDTFSMEVRYGEDGIAEFYTNFNNAVKLQVVEAVEVSGYYRRVYTINSTSSSYPEPEGLLHLYPEVRFNCSLSRCLVNSLTLILPVRTFRRIDHGPPFPDHFFGFMYHGSGSVPKYCHVGQNDCFLSCDARWLDVINYPSSISVTIGIVTPRGDVEAAQDQMPTSDGAYGSSWLYVHNVTMADSGRVYRCTARSSLKEISKDVELIVVQPSVRFIDDLTNVTRFENGTLVATCVAEGSPRPNVTMEVSVNGFIKDYHYDISKMSETTTRTSMLLTDRYEHEKYPSHKL